MNKPADNTRSTRPRRAEPLQPDRPDRGIGAGAAPATDPGSDAAALPEATQQEAQQQRARKGTRRQKEQADSALRNVRDGDD